MGLATTLTTGLRAERESLGVSVVNCILVMRGVRTSIASQTLAKKPRFRLARGVGLSSEFDVSSAHLCSILDAKSKCGICLGLYQRQSGEKLGGVRGRDEK